MRDIDKILNQYKLRIADKIKLGKLTVEEVERKLKGGSHEHTSTRGGN